MCVCRCKRRSERERERLKLCNRNMISLFEKKATESNNTEIVFVICENCEFLACFLFSLFSTPLSLVTCYPVKNSYLYTFTYEKFRFVVAAIRSLPKIFTFCNIIFYHYFGVCVSHSVAVSFSFIFFVGEHAVDACGCGFGVDEIFSFCVAQYLLVKMAFSTKGERERVEKAQNHRIHPLCVREIVAPN